MVLAAFRVGTSYQPAGPAVDERRRARSRPWLTVARSGLNRQTRNSRERVRRSVRSCSSRRYTRRPLVIAPPVCGVWAANIRQIVPLVSSWWGYDPVPPQVTEVTAPVSLGGATALCFSGGVDSFFSLLRWPHSIDVLACAIGYDMKLRDTQRRALVERSVRAVAAEMGQRAWVVASNLRSIGPCEACLGSGRTAERWPRWDTSSAGR